MHKSRVRATERSSCSNSSEMIYGLWPNPRCNLHSRVHIARLIRVLHSEGSSWVTWATSERKRAKINSKSPKFHRACVSRLQLCKKLNCGFSGDCFRLLRRTSLDRNRPWDATAGSQRIFGKLIAAHAPRSQTRPPWRRSAVAR